MVSAAILAACTVRQTAVLPSNGAALRPAAGAYVAQRPARRGNGSLTIRIRVPRQRRHAHYISASTRGATISLSGPQSLNQSVALTAGQNEIALRVEAGSYTASISTYDKAPVGGRIPAGANTLSSASHLPLTIVKGKSNVANFTLDGVVASLAVSGVPSGTIGTAFASPKPLTVVAKDAGGNTIVGTYENSLTLTDTDTSGHTSLATSGPDKPPTGKLVSSSDAAALNYDGNAGIVLATIHASATGATTGSGRFTPAPVLTSLSASAGLDGTSVTETLSGAFATGATTIALPNGSGVTAVDASSATPAQITATFFIDPHTAIAGGVNVTVQTSAGASSASKTFTVSTTGVDIVTKDTDTVSNAQPGICTDGASGELRHAMCSAASGDTIVFDTTSMCGADRCTIALNAPLPPIVQNQTIDGGLFSGGTPRVKIDGNSAYRAFWVDTGTVALDNLQIQNVLAEGGNGGNSEVAGGGGGAGLGGGLFVNQSSGTTSVAIANDYFYACQSTGGSGGNASGSSGIGGGGGGGMGAPGGLTASSFGGSGGGGVLGAGSASTTIGGANGGFGGGGGGGPDSSSTSVGTGGSGYAGNSAGSDGSTSGPGGAGGFGGGGGGGGWGSSAGFIGGLGGLGGGGGGGGSSLSAGGSGGNGGAGGGGGATAFAATHGTPGTGGSLATIKGGDGANSYGGGGAAAGPAIFVASGMLTTTNSGASSCLASAGASGGTGAFAGQIDSTPVYNNGGTVNGDGSTFGGISSALGSTTPSIKKADRNRRRRTRHHVTTP